MIPMELNVAGKLPVYFLDSADPTLAKESVADTAVTFRYAKQGDTAWTTKAIDATNWTEMGGGWYLVSMLATELDTAGKLFYNADATGCVSYPGTAWLYEYTVDDIATILDGIKGVGWTDETLKKIYDAIAMFPVRPYARFD